MRHSKTTALPASSNVHRPLICSALYYHTTPGSPQQEAQANSEFCWSHDLQVKENAVTALADLYAKQKDAQASAAVLA
jgi:hypothetical protein